jgi:hypothetical protein
MNLIISEGQLRILVEQEQGSKIEKKVKSLYDLAEETFKTSGLLRKLNLKFFATWGAAMGGFIKPLSDFIESGNFDMTPEQKAVVIVGVVISYFLKNEESIKEIYQKIKDEGLEEIFTKTKDIADKLKNAFLRFLQSINLGFLTVTEMMHYSFLIPIVIDLQSLATQTTDPITTAKLIAKRILASEVVLISGSTLYNLLKKILEKFSNKK